MIDDFAMYYQSLSEKEKLEIGKIFNRDTGGKLSQYNSPTPVVVAMLQLKNEDGSIGLLGIRRAIEPRLGQLALPGGFFDEMEDAQIAAAREVMEETGFETSTYDYEVFGLPVNTNNNLLIFMKNKVLFDHSIIKSMKLNPEVSEFVVIDEQTKLGFPLHERACQKYFEKNGLQKKHKI